MHDSSLESLAARIAELERRLALQERKTTDKDWRSVVGMFDDSEIMPQVIEEGRICREADRRAAVEGSSE